MAVQPQSVAQPVGELRAVAGVFDHGAGRAVDFLHLHAGADHALGLFIGGAHRIVHLLLFRACALPEDRAGHVAPVPRGGDEDIQHNAVARGDHGAVGRVVRVGTVGAEGADQPLPAGGPAGLVPAFDVSGGLLLGHPLVQEGDGLLHHGVIDAGSLPQGGDLLPVLAHTAQVHRRGTGYGLNVRALFHQCQQVAAGPPLVNSQLAGAHGAGDVGNGIINIVVDHQGKGRGRVRQAEQVVSEQDGAAVQIQIKGQLALHGADPYTGQIVNGRGIGDQNLGQALLFHFLPHPGGAVSVQCNHRRKFLPFQGLIQKSKTEKGLLFRKNMIR